MKLCFDSIDEVKEFVAQLKGTRGGKKGDTEEAEAKAAAPAPLAPPTQPAAFNPGGAPGFAPPAGGATPAAGGPFAPAAPAVAPEVMALVNRIVPKIDAAVAGGQPVESVLNWFRGEIAKAGHDASQATLDQVKTVFLTKLPVAHLETIAKLMAA